VVSNFNNTNSSDNLEIFLPAENPFDDEQTGVTMFVVPITPEGYGFESSYTLNYDDLGPFSLSPELQKTFISTKKMFTLEFSLYQLISDRDFTTAASCYAWSLT